MLVNFNEPHLSGNEYQYIADAVSSKMLAGNGKYTQLCQNYFQEKYNFRKCLLTTSCTDALEMAAILLGIKEGDEVIMPSFTFVSTANAFVLRGAKIIFADSRSDRPGINEDELEALITNRTKAIIPVHYAGIACDMDKIMEIANRYDLFVVEDAAQAIDSFYISKDGTKKALGSIGHMSAFSFHETKNIISGEGGMLVINDARFQERAEIIWEKGTNRSSFYRGEVDKYGWVDIGSSFLPSEIIAAFLWAQLESMENIQNKRKELWNTYYNKLGNWSANLGISLPIVPDYSTNNAHIFYLICKNNEQRTSLLSFLKNEKINAVFHYLSLHSSPYYSNKYLGDDLINSDRYSECLIRLPLYYNVDINRVIDTLLRF
jgi:dTDP-4-amino-4,6-dideoxygalactose transaminase